MWQRSNPKIKVRFILHYSIYSIPIGLRIPDKTILVPLTNSLYVPGKLCDLENVIVDVGTGYYVKKVCGPTLCSFVIID